MTPDLPVLARVATVGLTDASALVAEPMPPDEWGPLSVQVVVERLEGLLAAAVANGSLPVSGYQLDGVRRLGLARARTDLLLERETLRAIQVLQAADVDLRLLKGSAWAHSAYTDPVRRGFGDVDILVRPADWYRAVGALEDAGGQRVMPELRPRFDSRFGKDATVKTSNGWEIDLHRTLVVGPYGLWIDCDALFARNPATVRVASVALPVLDPDAAFIHACYNAALSDDPPRLAALRDVAQMALSENIDAEEAWSLVHGWRGTNVVRYALRAVQARLGVSLALTPVGQRFAGDVARRDRMLIATYRGGARGYTSQLAGVVAIPGLADKRDYLAALLRPQRAYLDRRGLSWAGFGAHALGRLRRSR